MRGDDILEQKIITLMETVFNIDLSGKRLKECNPKNISNWDSLNFLNLVLVLEEEFNISFDQEDITYMIDGGDKILERIIERST